MRDLTNMRFGHLIACDKFGVDKWGSYRWLCKCDCGNTCVVNSSNLIRGLQVSCGCYRDKRSAEVHAKDITGKRYGKLVALNPTEKRYGSFIVWHCKCDCGRFKDVSLGRLQSGDTKSCGNCGYAADRARKRMQIWTTADEQRIVSIYSGMKTRCYNSRDGSYIWYGANGIRICDEWLDPTYGRRRFVEWSLTHGYSKDKSIDRIDSRGNYCPENCRWVSALVQANNVSTNCRITIGAITMTIAQWAVFINRPKGLLYRLHQESTSDLVCYIRHVLTTIYASDDEMRTASRTFLQSF